MTELPEVPDLAIVAVGAPLVDAVIDECGRKGVQAAVVVSAGFSETGPEGRAMEDQVVRTAERYGMALVGPNCMGVISAHNDLYATGFTLLRPEPGGASMVSQSGNLGTQLLIAAERRHGGVGKFVGVGNEAMIDAVDFINYFRTDPLTTHHRRVHGRLRRRPPAARRGPGDVAGETGGGAARRPDRATGPRPRPRTRGRSPRPARSSRPRPVNRG